MSETRVEPPFFPIYGDYTGDFPCFYDTSELSWARTLERAFPVIAAELEAYLARGGDVFRTNWDPYGFDVTGWKTMNFLTYGRRYHRNCREFPQTVRIIEAIPNVTSAFVNVLGPGTRIPAHCGDTNTTWRCHLGLIVPGGVDVCGIQVGDQRSGWTEGATIAICDAHRHLAWNDTDRDRVILIVDVMRPEYASRKDEICARVHAAIALTHLERRWGSLGRLRDPLLRAGHAVLAVAFRVWLLLGRKLGR